MGSREPLAGWNKCWWWGRWVWAGPGMALEASSIGYCRAVIVGGQQSEEKVIGGRHALDAKIAAEDAARAMVADMAAALGGSVTWGESEVSECR